MPEAFVQHKTFYSFTSKCRHFSKFKMILHDVMYCMNSFGKIAKLKFWKCLKKVFIFYSALMYFKTQSLRTAENAISEKASWKVAWSLEHLSLWRLKCSVHHATFHEAKLVHIFYFDFFSFVKRTISTASKPRNIIAIAVMNENFWAHLQDFQWWQIDHKKKRTKVTTKKEGN